MADSTIIITNESTLITVLSVLTALFVFAGTIYQAWSTRRHHFLSVKPTLFIAEGYHETKEVLEIAFELQNLGTGTAIIESFTLLHGERKVSVDSRKSYVEFMEGLRGHFDNVNFAWVAPTEPLAVGQKVLLLGYWADRSNYSVLRPAGGVCFAWGWCELCKPFSSVFPILIILSQYKLAITAAAFADDCPCRICELQNILYALSD